MIVAKRFSISLQGPARSVCFALVIAVPTLVFVVQAVRLALAETWGETSSQSEIRRALVLEPRSANFHYRLGMVYLLGGGGSIDEALAAERQAVALNPNYATHWVALANACLVVSDRACSEHAFERALALSPSKPSIQWEAGIYFALQGDAEKTFSHLRRFLELNPERARDVFELTWKTFQDPEGTWKSVMRPLNNATVECAYLEFLLEQRRFDLAKQYWDELAKSGFPGDTSFAAVRPYVQALMEQQQFETVSDVWRDLVKARILQTTQAGLGNNLVFNADFQQPVLNTGFDWKMREETYVVVHFPANGGDRRTLQIEFTVAHNADDEPISQIIPVLPNQRYLLSARASSDGITSDSGPRLRVVDANCGSCLDVATPGIVGTTPWHDVKVAFSTGPQTRFVTLSIWRARSRTYPMDISGSVWFDNISLRAVEEDARTPREVSVSHN